MGTTSCGTKPLLAGVKNGFFLDRSNGLKVDTFERYPRSQAGVMWVSFPGMGFGVFDGLSRYRYWARVLVAPVFQ